MPPTSNIRLTIDRDGLDSAFTRAVIRKRVSRMVEHLQLEKMELSILLTGDAQIHQLNKMYRGKDRPTDVLAFAMSEGEFSSLAGNLLGDIIVSVPTARAQAKAQKKELLDEITMLLAHGLLHLLGWDHETVAKDRKMRAKTNELCEAAIATASKTRATARR